MINILETINDYSKKLSKVTKWHNSKDLISDVLTINTGEEQKEDFTYEFKCYIRIITDLKVNYQIEFLKGTKTGYSFPKKPANKEGKPYFILDNSTHKFQLCAGTKIETPFKTKRAPDISFQYASSPDKNPTYKDVFMIYDAKYSNKKLAYNAFSYFVTMVKDLGLHVHKDNKVIFDKYKKFDTNCILTNAQGLNDNIEYHKFHNIKVIEYFSQNKIFNVIG